MHKIYVHLNNAHHFHCYDTGIAVCLLNGLLSPALIFQAKHQKEQNYIS